MTKRDKDVQYSKEGKGYALQKNNYKKQVMPRMTPSRFDLPFEVILARLDCGLENHLTRKMEPILDTMRCRDSRANISATRFLGSFVSTDKGTTKIESQKKFKDAKPLKKSLTVF